MICGTFQKLAENFHEMDLQTFHRLIVQMQSANNKEREEAEKMYCKLGLASKASLLFSFYCTTDAPFEVMFSSVPINATNSYLRNLSFICRLFKLCDVETSDRIEHYLCVTEYL